MINHERVRRTFRLTRKGNILRRPQVPLIKAIVRLVISGFDAGQRGHNIANSIICKRLDRFISDCASFSIFFAP